MFSEDKDIVALTRKNHPTWQAGKLNGIGGKINDGESPVAAMVREFQEEAGGGTTEAQWRHYAVMRGQNDAGTGDFVCHCFATHGDVYNLRKQETEEIELLCTDPKLGVFSLHAYREEMIDNLCWLILLALDHLDDGRPGFVEIQYP